MLFKTLSVVGLTVEIVGFVVLAYELLSSRTVKANLDALHVAEFDFVDVLATQLRGLHGDIVVMCKALGGLIGVAGRDISTFTPEMRATIGSAPEQFDEIGRENEAFKKLLEDYDKRQKARRDSIQSIASDIDARLARAVKYGLGLTVVGLLLQLVGQIGSS